MDRALLAGEEARRLEEEEELSPPPEVSRWAAAAAASTRSDAGGVEPLRTRPLEPREEKPEGEPAGGGGQVRRVCEERGVQGGRRGGGEEGRSDEKRWEAMRSDERR